MAQIPEAEITAADDVAMKRHGRTGAGVLNSSDWNRGLFDALIESHSAFGPKTVIYEDPDNSLTFDRFLIGAFVLGRKLAALTEKGETVGVMLAAVVGAAPTVFSLFAFQRVAAMLNFTSGVANLESACKSAQIKTIITARQFIEKANLEELVAELEKTHRIVYLEDIRQSVGLLDKLRGAFDAKTAHKTHRPYQANPDDLAILLFTSGTEGQPKGVALTHANLLSNCAQFSYVVQFLPDDKLFNCLPVFHSFGMMAGLIAPAVLGLRCFLYPSPLHYHAIPEMVKKSGASILAGTDTFVSGWGRSAKGDEFGDLRYIVLGAEKVKEPTRALWRKKFGTELYEGYGVTETSPVLAANPPGRNRIGSAGLLMPGVEWRIDPVPGLEDGGRLFVRGPNVMAGYLTVDKPGIVQPLQDGWHDTGDIVSVDEEDYVTIRGRAKRFAKIGGEMVSLAAVEALAHELWPENTHCVANLPDPRKGEHLILVTDHSEAHLDELREFAREHGASELMIPKSIVHVEALPVLGSGKIDFTGVKHIAEDADPIS